MEILSHILIIFTQFKSNSEDKGIRNENKSKQGTPAGSQRSFILYTL